MESTSFFDSLKVIDSNINYWFVRTDSGQHFETFYKNGFIGIGWNFISHEDLIFLSPSEVQFKIAQEKRYDLNLTKGKSKATRDYNKLRRFHELNQGDVVIIPSHSSSRMAFGIVADESIFTVSNPNDDCEYLKRRKIEWIVVKSLSELDSKFYEIKISQHSISQITKYANYIDRVMSAFYFKNNTGNFVLQIAQEGNINLNDLMELMQQNSLLLQKINDFFELGENIEESSIKVNLQSKGTLTYIVPVGRSLATFCLIMTLYSCGKSEDTEYKINGKDVGTFNKTYSELLDSTAQAHKKNKVDLDNLEKELNR